LPTAQQFAFPFRVEGSQVATVDQDSLEEIRDCVIACLRTRLGSRLEVPDYGVANQAFKRQPRNPTADVYLRAVEAVEPRAALLGRAEVEGLIQRVLIKQGATQ
jgi:phage baseplate assembly protein W